MASNEARRILDPDNARGNHKVRVRGPAHGFGEVEVVLAISWLEDAVAVTVYSIDRK
jgi:hypothetical protein